MILYTGFEGNNIRHIGDCMKELILIPSYKPDEMLLEFLGELKKIGLKDVLLVDDGSGGEYRGVYEKATAEYPECEVIYHAVNLGKGRALKTGFNYALNKYPDLIGVVSCDADGQHPAETVKEAADAMHEHPDKLILGSRQFFKAKNVPKSNLAGNLITIVIFKLLTGLSFTDTQCGLRAFPKEVMEKLIRTKGERFEYENIMLLDLRTQQIGYCEIPMEAIYFEEEKQTSHFDKLKDSVLIYANILKFAALPIVAGLLSLIATIIFFTYLPVCSLLKTAIFYGAGLLIGWLLMLLPVPEDKGKWYTIFYPIAHTLVFSMWFYWLFNYTTIGFMGSWWICAAIAAPTGYAIYLRLRYGKKPKKIKIDKE
jgi:glycosyltransferase involved in cell wall biosynthesis